MKEIYILPIKEAESIPEDYCLKNFPVRMERAAKFRFREDKLRCIGAGALLCRVAGIREADIIYNEFGKPGCKGKNFSLSHSGKYIVLALSDGLIGVDVEDMSRNSRDISKRVCTLDELEWLNRQARDNNDKENADYENVDYENADYENIDYENVGYENVDYENAGFYQIWTLKECVMKAEGSGLSMDPRSFCVLPIIEGKSITIGNQEYYGESFIEDGHMFSVCGQQGSVKKTHITYEML